MSLFPAYSTSSNGVSLSDSGDVIPLPPVPGQGSTIDDGLPSDGTPSKLDEPCTVVGELPASSDVLPETTALHSTIPLPSSACVDPSPVVTPSLTSTAETRLQKELESLLSDSDTDQPDLTQAIDKHKGVEKSGKHKHKKKKDKKKKKKKKKSKRASLENSEGEENRSPTLANEGSHRRKDSRSPSHTLLSNGSTLNDKSRSMSKSRNINSSKHSQSGSGQDVTPRRSRSLQKKKSKSRSADETVENSKKSHSQLSYDKKSKSRDSKSADGKQRQTRSRSADNKQKESQSRSRDVSHRRSQSKSSLKYRSCSRSGDREGRRRKSRSMSHTRRQRKSRSRSCDRKRRKLRSRSRDKRQCKFRSRSRDRKQKRSRSLSRDKKTKRSRSRSLHRRLKRLRSRSRDRKSKRSRSRSKTSNTRKRSRDRYHRRTRSRSVSRKRLTTRSSQRRSQSRNRRRSKSVSRQEDRSKQNSNSTSQMAALRDNIPASSNKNTFVEIGSYVRYEYVAFTDTAGDKNNLAFPATHFTQLVRYRAPRSALGDKSPFDKDSKKKVKPIRYFQKKMRSLLGQSALPCTPIQEIETDELLEKVYIPTELTYAETLKISKQKNEDLKNAYEKSEFYLDAVDVTPDEVNKNSSADDTEYEYWMKQSKTYNERLVKEPKNEQLWLEFARFQERAFIHLYRGGTATDSCKSGSSQGRAASKSSKALAERKLALLEAGIKKNSHSLALQLERLAVGDEVWELDQLNREWATLVYNFPNNMTVWHRYVEHHATSSLQFRVSSAVSAASRCCEKLRLMAAGVFVTHAPPQQPGLCCIDLIAQVCRLWAQSGYRERGVALWQALIEYNLFSPEALDSTSHEHRMPLLEQFWDTRAPRVGEVGSVGWGEALRARQTAHYVEQILGERQHYDSVQYLLFWRLERRAGQFDEEDRIIEAAVSKHPILKLKNNKVEEGSTAPSPESASRQARRTSDPDTENNALAEDVVDEAALDEERRRERAAAENDAEYEARLSELWLQLEQLRERRHWLPYAADPDDCEDPDRIVAFEVLAPFVVLLPMADPTQQQTKAILSQTRLKRKWETETQYEQFYLVLRFLDFLGVEVREIERNLLEYLGIHEYEADCFEGLRLESFDPLFDSDVLSVCLGYTKVCGLVPGVGPTLNDTASDSYFQFICNVIERTMQQFDTEYSGFLAVLYIKVIIEQCKAFQQDNTKKSKLNKIEKVNKKLAKNLLKKEKFRSNLLVYKEYGALEECFGHFGDAEKVYITGLVVGSRDMDVFECDAATFRRVAGVCFAYIRLHLTAAATFSGNEAEMHTTSVLSVLCSLANDGRVLRADSAPVSSATLLRARKKLSELLEIAILTFLKSKKLTTCNNQIIVELSTYLALIQFFTSGFKSFCLIFEETIVRIENSEGGSKKSSATATNGASNKPCSSATLPRATALLLQALHEREAWLSTVLSRLSLPAGGAARSTLSPMQHRAMILSALSSAPDSPLLLALMAKIQSWRDLFCGLGGPEATVRQLVFRVLPHLSSATALMDSAVSDGADGWCCDGVCVPRTVLSALSGAVQRPSGRHCPLLWRLYLTWSALTQPGPATAALLYTALNNCPGNKSVYLSCVGASARRLKTDDSSNTVKLSSHAPALRSTVRLMEERGLRCRLPLQELQLLLQEEHEEKPERCDGDENRESSDDSCDSELEVLQETFDLSK